MQRVSAAGEGEEHKSRESGVVTKTADKPRICLSCTMGCPAPAAWARTLISSMCPCCHAWGAGLCQKSGWFCPGVAVTHPSTKHTN